MVEKYIKFFLYLIIIILINMVCQNHFIKIDTTKTKMYSLSEKSVNVVSGLTEPLTIKCFFSKDLPPPYNVIKQYLKDLLEEYSEYSNNNFNYEFVDPKNKDFHRLASEYGITPVQVQVIKKDELKYQSVYMGIVLIHGDAIYKIPVINTTNRLEYLLTSSMEKLINKVSYLLSLKENINIDLYLSKDLYKIAPYIGLKELSNYPTQVKNVIKDLNKKYYNKLNYNFIDLNVSNSNTEKLNKLGIQVLKWPEFKKAHLKSGQGGIGLVLEYNKEHISVPLLRVINLPLIGTQYLLTPIQDLKDIIETSIQSLLHINQSIGYITSHDTLPLYSSPFGEVSSANNFRKLLSECYDIKEIDLKKQIPLNIKTLIIAGPKTKFSDYELFQIDQALMHGTNLAIFLDKFKEIPGRQSMLLKNETGLEKLLNHYGIKIKNSIVMDKNCFKQRIPQEQGGGQRPIYFAPIIKSKNINHKLKYLENINGLVMLKNSPIEIDKKISKKYKVDMLFCSSKNSWEAKNIQTMNPLFIYPPKQEKMHKIPLAYIISGEFESYFKDKPIPPKEKNDKEKENKTKETKTNRKNKGITNVVTKGTKIDKGYGKIFIIGSSDILTDSVIDTQGDTPNSIFIMNVIDVLNDKIDRAILRAKTEEFNPLEDVSDSIKTNIKVFNILIVPIIVLLFGFFIKILRNRKRKKIKEMFI